MHDPQEYSKKYSVYCPIRFLWVIIVFLLFFFSGCSSSSPSTQETIPSTPTPAASPEKNIRIANGEWSPYDGETLPHYGCDAWVASEAFALNNITVEYGFFPWARAYSLAASGEWDGTIEWADSDTHREDFYISRDYLSRQEWAFFYLKSTSFQFLSEEDLTGMTIGITAGYEYGPNFQSLYQSEAARFEEASSDIANFHKLLAGHINLFLMEKNAGQMILENNFSPEEVVRIDTSERAIDEFLPRILLSRALPQNESLILLFDQGFEQLKESGRYEIIMEECFR